MAQKCDLDHNNTNFSKFMMAKIQKAHKIYTEASTAPESERKWIAHLKFYQFIVKLIIGNPEYCLGVGNNSRGLLMYAAMGMGKTRAAVASALAIKDDRPVVILLPKSLQTNMEKTIVDVCRMVGDRRTPEDLFNKFSFVSMDAFNFAKQLRQAGRGKKHPRTKLPQNEGLDGKLLIVDEAHNLFRSIINSGVGDGEDASNARQVYEIIMAAKDLRILFMTGTPAAKDPFEIVPCFNLLAGYPILPERYDAFCDAFIDYEKQEIKNPDKLANLLTGMVSHVSHELPTEPHTEGVNKGPGDDGWFPVELPIEVVEVEMSSPQYLAYAIIRDKEDREAAGKKFTSSVSTTPLSLPGKTSNAISTYYVKSRTISTYYDDQSGAIDELHSPKLMAATRYVEEAPGIVLIYSQFVESGGIAAMCRYLEEICHYQKFELPQSVGGGGLKNAVQMGAVNKLTDGFMYEKYSADSEIKRIAQIAHGIDSAERAKIEAILRAGPVEIKTLDDIAFTEVNSPITYKTADYSLAVDERMSQVLSVLICYYYLKKRPIKICPKNEVKKYVLHVAPNIVFSEDGVEICFCKKCTCNCAAGWRSVDDFADKKCAIYKPPFAPADIILFISDDKHTLKTKSAVAAFNDVANLRRTWATATKGRDRCVDCAAEEMVWAISNEFAEYDAGVVDHEDCFADYFNRRHGNVDDLKHIHGLLCTKTKTARMKHILNFKTEPEEIVGTEFIQVAGNYHSSKFLWNADGKFARFFVADVASALISDIGLIKSVLSKDPNIGKGRPGILALYTVTGDLHIIDGVDVIARNIIDGVTTTIVKIITRRELIESYVGEAETIKNKVISFGVVNDAPISGGSEGKRYAIISGAVAPKDRQRIQDILNSPENMHGEIIKVIAISKTGAEGLNLKNISMVIHLEPYWDMARHDQVVSRAVRMGSHDMLPRDERKVRNIILISKANETARKEMGSSVKEDKTIDQKFFAAAKEKKVLIEKLRVVMKQACIECRAFGYPNCYSCKPTNQKLYGYENDIERENPCVPDTASELEANELEIDGEKYYYITEPEVKIFIYSNKIDAYVPMSTTDPNYNKVRDIIDKN